MKFVFCIAMATYLAMASAAQDTEPVARSSPEAALTESDVLKAQLHEMQRSEGRILTTVYWTLGTCGGIVLLLIGFSWFLNFKVYERDKQGLKDDLATRTKTIGDA